MIKKHKLIVGIIVFIAILILIELSFRVYKKVIYTDEEVTISKSDVLKERDMFFTMQKCVSKYLRIVAEGNSEKIYNMLDEEYINRLQITKENLNSFIKDIGKDRTFKAKKIYVKDNNYYIYGEISEEVFVEDINSEEVPKPKDYYISIKLNTKTNTFSICPDGYMYSNNIKNTVKKDKITIKATQYTNYMDKCEVYLEIKNNSKEELNISDIQMLYYEEGIYSGLKEDETSNQDLIIKSGEEKSIKLVFSNAVCTPKKIIINKDKENELGIPIIKNLLEKK